MDDSKTQQMLSDQSTYQDPFSQAQAMQAQKNSMPDQNMLMQNDLFQPNTLSLGQQGQQASMQPAQNPSQVQTPAINALFQGATDDQRMQFEQSQLPKMLQKSGIDPKMLALNPLGRVQLMQKLRSKYGDGFQTNPDAQKMLSMFDETYNQANGGNPTQALNNANRTLQELYK